MGGTISGRGIRLPSNDVRKGAVRLAVHALNLVRATRRFGSLVVERSGGRVIHFDSVNHTRLNPTSVGDCVGVGKIPVINMIIVPRPNTGRVGVTSTICSHVREVRGSLPRSIRCGCNFSGAGFVHTSVGRMGRAMCRTFMLIVVVVFLFLHS